MKLSAEYLKRKEEWREELVYEMAMKLLRETIDTEIILKVTGLSIEQITELRGQLN